MRKKIFIMKIIGFLCLTSQFALSQISEGGTPVSFSLEIDMRESKIPVITMPYVDVQALLKEDERDKDGGIKPFRFGYSIDVDIDIKKDGLKETLSNGDNLWMLKIHSDDAISINLIYSYFRLGKGSKFYDGMNSKPEIHQIIVKH